MCNVCIVEWHYMYIVEIDIVQVDYNTILVLCFYECDVLYELSNKKNQ